MEEKYGSQIPVRQGNWISNWDTGGSVAPREKMIAQNGQTLLPVAEQMNALAEEYELGDYDSALFDIGWDQILQIDEHTGPGGCWSEYWTQEEVDAANEQYRQYALEALNAINVTLASGIDNLLGAATLASSDSIIVYNPLSWNRTDLARVPVTPELLSENFTLYDSVSGLPVTYQKDAATTGILFIARDVPAIGFKRYLIEYSEPAPPTTSLVIGSRSLENEFFQVTLDDWGYVTNIYDKTASREMIDSADAFDFNRMIQGTNLQWFFGTNDIVPDPLILPEISASMIGPVAAAFRVIREEHPHAGAEVIIYDGLSRIDIVDTPDRDDMLYASLADNSRYYGVTFPFNLTNAELRIDTAAGWCNLRTDMIEGSYKAAFCIQNGLDLSEANYGVTFATPDVYVHAVGGFQNHGAYPPANPTVVSTFIRYGDEADIIGPDPGYVDDEPGAPPQWDIRYSLRPHNRGFAPVAESRFGWEVCSPLQTKMAPAAGGGIFTESSLSFFSVDPANVIITSIKKADFGDGLIVKLQEIAGTETTAVTLASDIVPFYRVQPVTPLEDDYGIPLLLAPPSGDPPHEVSFSMDAREIMCLRILTTGEPPTRVDFWHFY